MLDEEICHQVHFGGWQLSGWKGLDNNHWNGCVWARLVEEPKLLTFSLLFTFDSFRSICTILWQWYWNFEQLLYWLCVILASCANQSFQIVDFIWWHVLYLCFKSLLNALEHDFFHMVLRFSHWVCHPPPMAWKQKLSNRTPSGIYLHFCPHAQFIFSSYMPY